MFSIFLPGYGEREGVAFGDKIRKAMESSSRQKVKKTLIYYMLLKRNQKNAT